MNGIAKFLVYTIGLLVICGGGFFLGWLAKDNLDEAYLPFGTAHPMRSDSAQPNIVNSQPPVNGDACVGDCAGRSMAVLVANIQNTPHDLAIRAEFHEEIVRLLNPGNAFNQPSELSVAMRSIPGFLSAMLEHIAGLDDRRLRSSLFDGFRFHVGFGDQYQAAERYVVDRIRSGDAIEKWAELLEIHSVMLAESFEYLTNRLPLATGPRAQEVIIKATQETSFIRPPVTPQIKRELRDLYEPYFESPHAGVRAAAVESQLSLPRDDQPQRLIDALNDESIQVRRAALHVLYNRETREAEVIATLLRMAADEGLSLDLRASYIEAAQAANATGSYEDEVYELLISINALRQQRGISQN